MISFFCGALVGAWLGMLLHSLMVASRQAEDDAAMKCTECHTNRARFCPLCVMTAVERARPKRDGSGKFARKETANAN